MKLNRLKLKNWLLTALNKYYFPLYLVGFIALIIGGYFWSYANYLVFVYVKLFSLLLTPEQTVMTLIVFRCLSYSELGVEIYLIFFMLVRYLLQIIWRQKKINFPLLWPLLFFALYLMLPIRNIAPLAGKQLWFQLLLFYLIYENREQIKFSRVLICLIITVMFSGFCGPMLLFSTNVGLPYATLFINKQIFYRYSGISMYPNVFACYAVITIAGLLLLRERGLWQNYWFYLCFVPIFIFGYYTISRNFLLCFVLILLVYSIILWLQKRWQLWRRLVPLLCIVVVVILISPEATKFHWHRLLYGNHSATSSSSYFTWFKLQLIDRGMIYQSFLGDWLAGPLSIILGIKNPTPLFTNAHNLYFEHLYENGLLGVVLILIFFAQMVPWRQLKSYFSWSRIQELGLFILPMLVFGLFEYNNCDLTAGILVLLYCCDRGSRVQESYVTIIPVDRPAFFSRLF